MKKQRRTDRGTSTFERRLGRAGTMIAGALLVVALAVPAAAEECTGDDTTLASTDCEGTVSVTTEEDTATVSVKSSTQIETDEGPVDADAGLSVDEEESTETPSYQGTEREVTVPGTETPELEVTTPRVDIREPVDVQAGGETTVPSISTDKQRFTIGGTKYGVPDEQVQIDLFGSESEEDDGVVTTQPRQRGAGSGHLVEGAYGTTTGSSPATTSGADHHLTSTPPHAEAGGRAPLAASDPVAGRSSLSASTGSASPGSASTGSASIGSGGLLEGTGNLIDAAFGAYAPPEGGAADTLGSSAGSAVVWIAAVTMLALAGAALLLARRHSRITVA
ncbi:MAG: hypothetical protein KY469_21770 [Actinobacteria bacterium]|nr:hypothetical protein [Actinomycetota bacterium]